MKYRLYIPSTKQTYYADKIFYKNGFIHLTGNVKQYNHDSINNKYEANPDMAIHGISCIRTKIEK